MRIKSLTFGLMGLLLLTVHKFYFEAILPSNWEIIDNLKHFLITPFTAASFIFYLFSFTRDGTWDLESVRTFSALQKRIFKHWIFHGYNEGKIPDIFKKRAEFISMHYPVSSAHELILGFTLFPKECRQNLFILNESICAADYHELNSIKGYLKGTVLEGRFDKEIFEKLSSYGLEDLFISANLTNLEKDAIEVIRTRLKEDHNFLKKNNSLFDGELKTKNKHFEKMLQEELSNFTDEEIKDIHICSPDLPDLKEVLELCKGKRVLNNTSSK